MAEDDDPAQPRSLKLMAGPVDCRVKRTGVNDRRRALRRFQRPQMAPAIYPRVREMIYSSMG